MNNNHSYLALLLSFIVLAVAYFKADQVQTEVREQIITFQMRDSLKLDSVMISLAIENDSLKYVLEKERKRNQMFKDMLNRNSIKYVYHPHTEKYKLIQ